LPLSRLTHSPRFFIPLLNNHSHFVQQNYYRYTPIAMSQQEEDVKPSVKASATPSTPTKKRSVEKTPTTPNKSPAKLPPGEMQRGKKLALEALMDFAVKGPMVDIVAEKVSQTRFRQFSILELSAYRL
jgi:hypothetical protein